MTDNPPDEPTNTPLSDLQDAQLLQLASHSGPKSERAFRELYDRHNFSLTNYIQRRFGFSDEVVEDIVAGAWRRVHLHGHRHDPSRSQVSSWLYVIGGNLAKNELRNRDRDRETHISDLEHTWGEDARSFEQVNADPDARSPEEQTELRELEEAVERAIENLRPQHKLPVLLRLEGYSYQEIAEVSGVKLGTAKSRLNRARTGLKEELALAGVDLSRWLDMS